MTTEQFEAARKLEKEISNLQEKEEKLERLEKRAREITGPYADVIRIQLGEQYINTPIATVSIGRFYEFIGDEIERIDKLIKEKRKEFEAI